MYGDDLAYIHAVGFADFSVNAGPGILAMLREGNLQGGVVLDLGCGGGQWLQMLTKAGYDAFGLDSSPSFARLAKKNAPNALVRYGSLWDQELPICTAVTALGEVVSYLPNRSSRPPSLRRLFSRVHSALKEDGLFIFDMLIKGKGPMNYLVWRTGDDWAVMVEIAEDVAKARVHRTLEIFRKRGQCYERSVEHHTLRVTERDVVVNLLRDVGFSVRTSKKYGDFDLLPRRMAFCARRR